MIWKGDNPISKKTCAGKIIFSRKQAGLFEIQFRTYILDDKFFCFFLQKRPGDRESQHVPGGGTIHERPTPEEDQGPPGKAESAAPFVWLMVESFDATTATSIILTHSRVPFVNLFL